MTPPSTPLTAPRGGPPTPASLKSATPRQALATLLPVNASAGALSDVVVLLRYEDEDASESPFSAGARTPELLSKLERLQCVQRGAAEAEVNVKQAIQEKKQRRLDKCLSELDDAQTLCASLMSDAARSTTRHSDELAAVHSLLTAAVLERDTARADCTAAVSELAAFTSAAAEEAAAAARASAASSADASAEHKRQLDGLQAALNEKAAIVESLESAEAALRVVFERALEQAMNSSSPADIERLSAAVDDAAAAHAATAEAQAAALEANAARNAGWRTAAGASSITVRLRALVKSREVTIQVLELRVQETAEAAETAEANFLVVQQEASSLAAANLQVDGRLAVANNEADAAQLTAAEAAALMADAAAAGDANSAVATDAVAKCEAAMQQMRESLEELRSATSSNTSISQSLAAESQRMAAPAVVVGSVAGAPLLLRSLVAGTLAEGVTAALLEISEAQAASRMRRDFCAWALLQGAAMQQACAFMLKLDLLGVKLGSAQTRATRMARCMDALRGAPDFVDAYEAIAPSDRGDWRFKVNLAAMHRFLHS